MSHHPTGADQEQHLIRRLLTDGVAQMVWYGLYSARLTLLFGFDIIKPNVFMIDSMRDTATITQYQSAQVALTITKYELSQVVEN